MAEKIYTIRKRRKMKKRFLLVMIMVVAMVLLAACGGANQTDSEGKLTDILGNQLTVEKPYTKIISLSPAATEILYAIDADEVLLANTTFCNYPEDADKKPKIGDFSNPNIELILEYEPDLVVTAAGVQEEILNKFKELNIEVFCLDAHNIDDVLKNIEMAGIITGKETEAATVVKEMNDSLDQVAEKTAKINEKPTVFVEIWDEPLMTAGATSFTNDIIERAGGINIAADVDSEFPEYSKETLLEKDPDIYILLGHDKQVNNVGKRAGFEVLQAVKNERVFIAEDDLLTICGPRVVDGVEMLYNYCYGE
jgi:iron complex transport system substrate-binding protein